MLGKIIRYGFYTFIAFFCVMLGLAIITSTININEECNVMKIDKLVSFNGMKDKDTGLFSSGSTEKNLLLFESGKLITFTGFGMGGTPSIIILGDYYKILECKSFMNNPYEKVEYMGSSHFN